MKIALIGASSTGKSTLAKQLSVELNIPLIREQARVVLAELGKTLAEIRANKEDILHFQQTVLEYQIASELECADSGFVSDRSVFDNLTLYLRHCPLSLENVKFYQDSVLTHYHKYPYDFLIFLRPGEFPIEEDGVRTPDPFYQAQVDGMIIALLHLFCIPYQVVHGDVPERIRAVKELVAQREARKRDNIYI